jgi:hypothetical protein
MRCENRWEKLFGLFLKNRKIKFISENFFNAHKLPLKFKNSRKIPKKILHISNDSIKFPINEKYCDSGRNAFHKKKIILPEVLRRDGRYFFHFTGKCPARKQ